MKPCANHKEKLFLVVRGSAPSILLESRVGKCTYLLWGAVYAAFGSRDISSSVRKDYTNGTFDQFVFARKDKGISRRILAFGDCDAVFHFSNLNFWTAMQHRVRPRPRIPEIINSGTRSNAMDFIFIWVRSLTFRDPRDGELTHHLGASFFWWFPIKRGSSHQLFSKLLLDVAFEGQTLILPQ